MTLPAGVALALPGGTRRFVVQAHVLRVAGGPAGTGTVTLHTTERRPRARGGVSAGGRQRPCAFAHTSPTPARPSAWPRTRCTSSARCRTCTGSGRRSRGPSCIPTGPAVGSSSTSPRGASTSRRRTPSIATSSRATRSRRPAPGRTRPTATSSPVPLEQRGDVRSGPHRVARSDRGLDDWSLPLRLAVGPRTTREESHSGIRRSPGGPSTRGRCETQARRRCPPCACAARAAAAPCRALARQSSQEVTRAAGGSTRARRRQGLRAPCRRPGSEPARRR